MKRLSPESYWNSVYDRLNPAEKSSSSFSSTLKEKIKFYTRDYSNYLIWEFLFKKFLPKSDKIKTFEVGCAPGKYLINFKNYFGHEPYGVEYSEKGTEITRDNFSRAGLNDKNIIFADFFDKNFQEQNKGLYDVVFSRGFIEHFDNVDQVVKDHLNLLKPGGHLVILIPNLQGLNYYLARFLNRTSFDLHNTSIMEKNKFSKIFSENNLTGLYSNYVGYFSIGLFNTDKKWKNILYRIFLVLQRPADFFMRVFFGNILIRNRYTSPYLLFIGIKR